MISELTTMNFFVARDIIVSELEQGHPIGKLILRNYPNFDRVIRIMVRELEIALLNDQEEENALMSKEMFEIIKRVPYDLTLWTLRYPEYSWHNFISAFVLIYENYLDVQDQILLILQERDAENFDESWGLIRHDIDLLKTEVYPALRNLSIFGNTMKDLILIARDTLEELRELRQVRPVSMQLSEAYLKSLGI